ncbi:MAG: V-type ATPase subunit [Spirochaetes bacterium]|nr:V-type ATPase subunit [Spirochaetota bacterium]
MNQYATKTYLRAKIQAMRPSLIARGGYDELIRAGAPAAAFPDLFTAREIPGIDQTRSRLFRRQITPVLRFMEISLHYRPLFGAFLALFELDNIKSLASRAYRRGRIPAPWYDVSPWNTVAPVAEEREMAPDDLCDMLAPSPYGRAVEGGAPPSYEVLEYRLDFTVVENLIRYAQELPRQEGGVVLETIAWRGLSLRLLWGLRMTAFYGARREDDVPGVEDLTALPLPRKAGLPGIEKAIRRAVRARFPCLDRPGIDELAALELFLDRLFLLRVAGIFTRDLHGIHPVLSFAWQLYYQIRNLLRIVEGFHYRLPPETIVQRIVTVS